MENDVSQRLIDEINSAEPKIVVTENQALVIYEQAHEAIITLGLANFHNRICRNCNGWANASYVDDAENLMWMVKSWLRYKNIPSIFFWYPAKQVGNWVRIRITAAPEGETK